MSNPTPEKPKRRRLSPERRRAQLVEISLELLLEGALEGVTVDNVASRAEVSRSLIFHYFPTIRELHLATLEAAAAVLTSQFEAVVGQGTAAEQLAKGVDVFVAFIELQPTAFDALSAMAATDAEFGEVFQAVRDQAASFVAQGLGEDPGPVRRYRLASWVSFVESMVRAWIRDDAEVARAELIAEILDVTEAFVATRGD